MPEGVRRLSRGQPVQVPSQPPGLWLMLLRMSLGLLLANHLVTSLRTSPSLRCAGLLALAVGIWVGLFTPILSLIALLIEASLALAGHRTSSLNCLVTMGLCLATAMLGSGGYSVDGLLFGKRRVLL